MRHYLQMSFQEIAERTGVSINTALGRMRYALADRHTMFETAYLKQIGKEILCEARISDKIFCL